MRPATDLEARLTERWASSGRGAVRGFRPGKVPMAHLRKLYGKAVMAETIEALIASSTPRSSRIMV